MTAFETWMRSKLHLTHYRNGWFWHEYRKDHNQWPTLEMMKRGAQMREEYLRELELAKRV